MRQFAIYRNKNPKSKTLYPYLIDAQSDLLSDLNTRVVIPLTKRTTHRKKPIRDLTPAIEIGGDLYLVLTPRLAGVPIEELGPTVADASAHRDEIIAALDFLITGV